MQFAVRVGLCTWGPFDDADTAAHFAQFVTREIDPADVVLLHDPSRELLSWYRASKLGGGDKMTEPQFTEGAPETHTGTDVGDGRETRPGGEPRPDASDTDTDTDDETETGEQS